MIIPDYFNFVNMSISALLWYSVFCCIFNCSFMKTPLILVNFKVYQEAHGENAIRLARIHEKVAKETGVSIALAVSALDVATVSAEVSLPVFVQHVDPYGFGAYTGYIIPQAVKQAGAYGTLLNHSEHRLSPEILKQSIDRAHSTGLFVVACAGTAEEGEMISAMGPDMVAVEPPDLIGGDISVSKAQPGIIEEAVRRIGRGKVLVGAGVKNGEDVRTAIALGASGVLLASGITKAVDPEKVLRDLISGL